MASLAPRDAVFRAAAAGSGNRILHSYAVASKGSPEMPTIWRFEQSLGCVELPYGAAGMAWPYLTYGEPCHRIGLT